MLCCCWENMKFVNLCVWILLAIVLGTVVDGKRFKRNAFQLCSLISKYSRRSCLDYNPYGCFCGYGQQGRQPVDGTDRCCKEHDDCYGEVHSRDHCYFWSGLFVGYNFHCENHVCRCTDETKCSRKVCECDLKLAMCLGKSAYNQEYASYDRTQCT